MTTTDIDAIRKHIQLAEDWAEYGHVGDPNWHVARTLIKKVPALLDELAQTRIDRDERLTLKESSDLAKMVDAAREELAKTRADVEKLTTALDIVALREIRQAADLAIAQREWKAWEHLANKAAKERNALRAKYEPTPAGTADAEAANPATTAEPAANLPCHCPDGRRVRYCLVHGEKATAEPAGEPKAVTAEWIETAKAAIANAGPIVTATSEAEPAAG